MNEKDILEFLSKETYRPLKTRELFKKMGIPQEKYATFRRLVRSLLRQGAIVKLRRNRLGLPEKLNLIAGKLSVNPHGFGFLRPDDNSPDIYINPQDTGTALDGDRVLVRLTPKIGKSREGHVIKILERERKTIVGTLRRQKHFYFVEPDDKHIHRDIYIAEDGTAGAKPGQKVMVNLETWEDSYLNPEGKVMEVLGYADQPGVDILSLIKSYHLPLDFPSGVLAEVETVSPKISKAEITRRLDLRKKTCFTIDPIDAKDFDDAVSLEKLPNGNWLLGVHIADVSFYVEENSNLDKEALERGNSIYLVDRVIPMFPHKLSNEICSLNPREDRLTFSCLLELDKDASLVEYELKESILKSKNRLNYDEVQALFDGKIDTPQLEKIRKPLQEMLTLSKKLLKKRLDQGSLDFDLPEAKVVLDKEGNILDVHEALRLDSHRLIEEFMLLANRTVAEHIFSLGIPFLYRVHDKPDEEKLDNFTNLVKYLGYDFKLKGSITPKKIQRFLSTVEGKPEAKWINHLLLRSLKKACYQPEDIGHFGLAFRHYTHFTSPIRRYADLVVHRILKSIKDDKYRIARIEEIKEKLSQIGRQVSERERLAEEVERESIKLKQIEYLEDKLGEIYQGIITGFVSFGFFVQLNKLLIEGLVRLSSLEDDYYNYDENKGCLIGKHTNKRYSLGQSIEVQIVRVDRIQKQVDLVLVEKEGKPRKSKRQIRGFEWKRKKKY
ncbi:MAG: ribonuclease R [candidate division Zixibacteria bacterium]|nr:ribonuclease R [candidate division Zixibacteria bacterium]